MQLGKPRFAVWTPADNTVRFFEMDSTGKFVQTVAMSASIGTDQTGPVQPYFFDGLDVIAWMRKTALATGSGINESYDFSGNLVSTLGNRPGSMGGIGAWVTGASKNPNHTFMHSSRGASQPTAALGANGAFDSSSPTGQPAARNDANITKILISPDETSIIYFSSLGSAVYVPITSFNGRYPIVGATYNITPVVKNVVDAEWTPDGKYLITATADGYLQIYTITFTGSAITATKVYEINPGYGAAKSVSMRYDGRIFAIGFDDGTTKRTVVYQRYGTAAQAKWVFTGMGGLLDWTADGQYLCDAINKKALKWVDIDTIMTNSDATMQNMPSGLVTQAMSYHVDLVYASGNIYDAGVLALAAGPIDLTNLKLALLTGATFVHGDATPANALTHEVYGDNWPQGGVVITNVTKTASGPGIVKVAADDLKQIIVDGSLTFNQIIIYDATNNVPIVMFTYTADQTGEANTKLVFDLLDGFIQYVT